MFPHSDTTQLHQISLQRKSSLYFLQIRNALHPHWLLYFRECRVLQQPLQVRLLKAIELSVRCDNHRLPGNVEMLPAVSFHVHLDPYVLLLRETATATPVGTCGSSILTESIQTKV